MSLSSLLNELQSKASNIEEQCFSEYSERNLFVDCMMRMNAKAKKQTQLLQYTIKGFQFQQQECEKQENKDECLEEAKQQYQKIIMNNIQSVHQVSITNLKALAEEKIGDIEKRCYQYTNTQNGYTTCMEQLYRKLQKMEVEYHYHLKYCQLQYNKCLEEKSEEKCNKLYNNETEEVKNELEQGFSELF